MRYLFFVLSFLFYGFANAQHNDPEVNPSAGAVALGEFGNTPINLHHGNGTMTFPLFEVAAKHVSIPVAITGRVGAVPVAEMSSNVGLGWSLNSGGIITRQVKGLPDDQSYGILSSSVGCGNAKTLHDDMAAGSFDESNLFRQNISGNYEELDASSDEYYFNVNGVSGKFYFDENCNIVTSSLDDLKIIPIIEGNSGFLNDFSHAVDPDLIAGSSKLRAFIIHTPDGTKYYFEKRSWSQYYESDARSVPLQNGRLHTYSNQSYEEIKDEDVLFIEPEGRGISTTISDSTWNERSFAPSSWHLTKVLNKFGRIAAEYHYEAEYSEDKGVLDMINLPSGDNYSNSIRGYGDGRVSITYFKNRNYNQRIVRIGWPYILTSYDQKIEFEYSEDYRTDVPVVSRVGRFGNGYQRFTDEPSGFDLPRSLVKVALYNSKGDVVKEAHFEHDYYDQSLSDYGAKDIVRNQYKRRLWLKKLWFEQPDRWFHKKLPPVEFVYNNPQSLPHRYSPDIDLWGYYKPTRLNHLIPKMYFYPEDQNPRGAFSAFKRTGFSGTEYYFDEWGDRNENTSSALYFGTIGRIVYPTGGEKIYFYEPNEFFLYGRNYKGSGARIRAIKTLNKATPDNYKSFNYTVGKLYSAPCHGALHYPTYELSPTLPHTKTALYGRNRAGFSVPSMVGYEEVETLLWGLGSIRNYFSLNVHEEVDYFSMGGGVDYELPFVHLKPAHSNPLGSLPFEPIYPFPDRMNVEHLNGLPEKTEMYNESGALVSSKETIYDPFNVKYIYGVKGYLYYSIKHNYDIGINAAFYKRVLADIRPIEIIEKYIGQNGVELSNVTELAYGVNHRLPTQTKQTHSTGQQLVRNTLYVQDIRGNHEYADGQAIEDLINDYRIYTPIKTIVSLGGVEIDANYIEYKSWNNLPGSNGSIRITMPSNYYQKKVDTWRKVRQSWYNHYEGFISSSRTLSFPIEGYQYNNRLQLFKKTYGQWEWNYEFDDDRKLIWEKDNNDLIVEYDSDNLGTFSETWDRGAKENRVTSSGINFLSNGYYVTAGTSYSDASPDNEFIKYDGFGKEYFRAKRRKGANGEDQNFLKFYDDGGRVISETYLPGNYIGYAYDNSPLNRKVLETLPDGETRRFEHNVNASPISVPSGYTYPSGSLKEGVVIDENGNSVKSYSDKMGNLILTVNTGGGATYYKYDNRNRLVAVIPPGGGGPDDPVSYQYDYDCHNRMVTKRIASSAPTYLYYNENDLLVGEQDGNMRTKGRTLIYSYDEYGRNTGKSWGTPTPSSGSSGCLNYVTTSSPTGQLLVSTVYDDRFKNSPKVQSVKVLGHLDINDAELINYTYSYDNFGRLTSTGRGHLFGGNYVVENKMIHTDQDTSYIHSFAPGGFWLESYEFDQANRVKYIKHWGERVIHQTYTHKGQLATKRMGYTGQTNSGDGPEYLQQLNYGYTPRGWLKKINTIPTRDVLPLPECGGDKSILIEEEGECGDSATVLELIGYLRFNDNLNIDCYEQCEYDSICYMVLYDDENIGGCIGVTEVFDQNGDLIPLDYPYMLTNGQLMSPNGTLFSDDLEAYIESQGYPEPEISVSVNINHITSILFLEKTAFKISKVKIIRNIQIPPLEEYVYPHRYSCERVIPENNYGVNDTTSTPGQDSLVNGHLQRMSLTNPNLIQYPTTLYAITYRTGLRQYLLEEELLINPEDLPRDEDPNGGGYSSGGPSIIDVDCIKVRGEGGNDEFKVNLGNDHYELDLREFISLRNIFHDISGSELNDGDAEFQSLYADVQNGQLGDPLSGDPGPEPDPGEMDEDCFCTYVDSYHPASATDALNFTTLNTCDPCDPICDNLVTDFPGHTNSYVTDGVFWKMVEMNSADKVAGQVAWSLSNLENELDPDAEILDFEVEITLGESSCPQPLQFGLSLGTTNLMLEHGTTTYDIVGGQSFSTHTFSYGPAFLIDRSDVGQLFVQMGVFGCDSLAIDGIHIFIKYRIPCDGDEEVDDCDHEGPYCNEAQLIAQHEAMAEIKTRRNNPTFYNSILYPTQLHRVRLCDGTETYVFDFELEILTPRWQVLQTIDIAGPDSKVQVDGEGGGVVKKPRFPLDDENEYDLFGLDLGYDPVGNVTGMLWAMRQDAIMQYTMQYNSNYWLTKAEFIEKGVSGFNGNDKYTVKNITYDARGNIQTLVRHGLKDPCVGQTDACGRQKYDYQIIDDLNYQYNSLDRNKIDVIHESSSEAHGYRKVVGSVGGYAYDANGNIKSDNARDIYHIEYNYLNQPLEIRTPQGSFFFTYDALGTRLKSSIVNPNGQGRKRIDYVGPFELHDKTPIFTYFADGRTSNDAIYGTRKEFFINDHLGNLRVSFADRNGNGFIDIQTCPDDSSEILQLTNYYPFGLTFSNPYQIQVDAENPYQYNGIEKLELPLLDINHTLYRTLDPAVGRWLQVDPKAEYMYDYAPHNSMGNNPGTYADPDGDLPFLVFAAAAVIGGGMNLYSNWGNTTGFFDGLSYFTSGAVGGAVGVVNPAAGMAIAGAGNLATDWANGSLANLNGVEDWATHVGFTALEGVGAGGAGSLAKGGFNLIQKWGWTNYNQFVNLSSAEIASMTAEGIAPSFATTVETVTAKVTSHQIINSSVSVAANTAKGGNQLLLNAPKVINKHHVLPQQFRSWFAKRGISNIDDFTVPLSRSAHLKGVHGKGLGNMPGKWNNRWAEFIKANPNATPSQIFHQAEGMLQRFGLEHLRYVPYK